jgi:hypothetical protein
MASNRGIIGWEYVSEELLKTLGEEKQKNEELKLQLRKALACPPGPEQEHEHGIGFEPMAMASPPKTPVAQQGAGTRGKHISPMNAKTKTLAALSHLDADKLARERDELATCCQKQKGEIQMLQIKLASKGSTTGHGQDAPQSGTGNPQRDSPTTTTMDLVGTDVTSARLESLERQLLQAEERAQAKGERQEVLQDQLLQAEARIQKEGQEHWEDSTRKKAQLSILARRHNVELEACHHKEIQYKSQIDLLKQRLSSAEKACAAERQTLQTSSGKLDQIMAEHALQVGSLRLAARRASLLHDVERTVRVKRALVKEKEHDATVKALVVVTPPPPLPIHHAASRVLLCSTGSGSFRPHTRQSSNVFLFVCLSVCPSIVNPSSIHRSGVQARKRCFPSCPPMRRSTARSVPRRT